MTDEIIDRPLLVPAYLYGFASSAFPDFIKPDGAQEFLIPGV
jgi:hypothetical protein